MRAPPDKCKRQSSPAPARPISRTPQGPFRAFVVEDHPATARGFKVFLELACYVVTIASVIQSEQELAPAAENGDRPVAAAPKKRTPARKRSSTPAKVRS